MLRLLAGLVALALCSRVDASVRGAVESFYTAWAAGDRARVMAHWREDAPERAAFERAFERFRQTRCVVLHEVAVEQVDERGNDATAAARIVVTKWSDMPGARPRIETLHATFVLRRAGDGWQIVSFRSREEELARQLASLTTHGEREALLSAHPALRTPALAHALAMRALQLLNEVRFAESRQALALAADVAHEQADDAAIAVTLMVQSALEEREHGDGDAAVATSAAAIELAERSGDPDALAWALIRHGRARWIRQRDDSPPFFLRVLDNAPFIENPAVIARAATQMAHYSDAELDHREALRYSELASFWAGLTDDVAARTSALVNLGGAYANQSDFELARPYFEEALPLARGAGFKPMVRDILSHLATCYGAAGELQRALEANAEALAIGPETPGLLSQRAEIHRELGDEQLEERYLLAAVRRAHTTSVPYDDRRPATGLAMLRVRQRRYAEALAIADAAMCEVEEPFRNDLYLVSAMALRRLGHRLEARRLLEQLLDSSDRPSRAFGTERQRSLLNDSAMPRPLEYADLLIDLGDARAAYAAAQPFRARTLLDALAREHRPIAELLNATELQEYRRREQRIAELNRAIGNAGSDKRRAAALREELAAARTALADFEARVGALHEREAEDRRSRLPESGEAGSPVLPADLAVVEYMVTHERTIAFALTRGANGETVVRSAVIAIGRDELRRQVDAFLQRIARRDHGYGADARRLYDLLLKPVERDIAGRTLCIVPHLDLWRLPFHALQRTDRRHVAEAHALFYAPAASMLTVAVKRPRAAAELLAIANPSIDGGTASAFRSRYRDAAVGPLPDAEAEVRALARLYRGKDQRVYIGAEARESVFKREAGHYRVLHVATHGMLDGASPMFSSLLLATGGEPDEDGLLEAREIAGLRLAADVAVLAACDTARGRISTGDGVMGMSWALLIAGCPNAVVSQWKAESAATARLMVDFHRRLVAGTPLPVAMQDAQRALLRERRYAHPFYWAPFVLVGSGKH